MHVKSKYIQAVEDAIEFISHNTDGASDEHDESETLTVLREISVNMRNSEHKRLVKYFVKKLQSNNQTNQ